MVLDIVLFLILAALFAWRLWVAFPRPGATAARKRSDRALVLVVLGGGVNTAEMMADLRSLGSHLDDLDFVYLLGENDRGSLAQAEDFEWGRRNPSPPLAIKAPPGRTPGQGLMGGILSTLSGAWLCLRVILALRPDLVLCNGPGICEPVVFATYVLRVLGVKRVLIQYSECLSSVENLTDTGAALYDFVDRFIVQWPEVIRLYREADYGGRLYTEKEVAPVRVGEPLPEPADLPCLPLPPPGAGPPTVLVNVGTAQFDELMLAIDRAEFLEVLHDMGVKRLRVQRGRSFRPLMLERHGEFEQVDVEVVDFAKCTAAELSQAAIVITHAGVGAVAECLQAGARTVAVLPNGQLDRQRPDVELACALHRQGLVVCCQASKLVSVLREEDFVSLRRYPTRPSTTFTRCVSELLYGGPARCAVRG